MQGQRNGFRSDDQERNFRTANERVRRGGPDAPICGARTRTGSACQCVPILGSGRCIRHCGRTVAREYRERQRRDYQAGRLSHEDWSRAEAKRAANRLHYQWKKDPWMPGTTIDLGDSEHAFRVETGLGSHSLHAVPPAVLDFLRWKYRRLQIDRKRDTEWMRVLRDDLPRRLNAAGPCPAGVVLRHEQQAASVEALWRGDKPSAASKRITLDQPKAPKRAKLRPMLRKAKVRQDSDDASLATFLYTYREALAPHFERCRSADEQMAVVGALQAYVADPNDRAARDRWFHTIKVLNAR